MTKQVQGQINNSNDDDNNNSSSSSSSSNDNIECFLALHAKIGGGGGNHSN